MRRLLTLTISTVLLVMTVPAVARSATLSEQASGSYSFTDTGGVAGSGTISGGTPINRGSLSFSLDCTTSAGTATVRDTSGDSIAASFSGVDCYTSSSTGSFTITGGTGKFAGATGSGTLTATNDSFPGVFRVSQSGTFFINRFTITHIRTYRDGTITFWVTVPRSGSVDVLVTAWDDNLARTALLQPAPHRFAFARQHLTARGAVTIHARVRPNAHGVLLIHHHVYRITLRLWVTYTPIAEPSRSIGIYGLHLLRLP